MKTRIVCVAVALFVAACSSTRPPPPPTSDSSTEEVVIRSDSGAEEIVVRGRSAPSQSEFAGVANSVTSFAAEDLVSAKRALARAMPGEEIWVIRRYREVAADADARGEARPGSGAMLATRPRRNAAPDSEPEQVPMPLEHTAVKAAVAGYVGTVDVTQRFANPFSEKIEAVYLFPLPENAAVSEFLMTIGERRIRGILREREEAEKIYAQARAQGYQASLLTQHRPNIFEQKVANIEPGKQIDVEIRYFHTLAHHDGWYSFVFPTVVGPRYNPPGSTERPDASIRYLEPDERSGHDLNIDVELDAGVKIEEITASHAIRKTRTGKHSARIELASQTTLPNKDFVLKFRVAGETIQSNLLTYVDPKDDQGYFTLMLHPPRDIEALRRQPLELVFVVDCSGSMDGAPIAQAKDAILAALDRLEWNDTFQIIQFSMTASRFGSSPLHATPENIRRAREYVQSLDGEGGTQMIEGIRAALDFPHDPERLRFVTFLTDGYIGNEREILAAIHARLGDSRIFSFGVGSSVNRYLLDSMASVGRGAVAYLGLQDSGREVMDFFFDRISHPALIDVAIDWGDMRVSDVYPTRLPDLFVGRPVVVTGKYLGRAGEPRVMGRAGSRDVAFTLPHGADTREHSFLPALWARSRIADLCDQQIRVENPSTDLARAIKETALGYGLVSDYTAFVAVDASRVTEGEHGTTVIQAVPVPEGVRYETTVTR